MNIFKTKSQFYWIIFKLSSLKKRLNVKRGIIFLGFFLIFSACQPQKKSVGYEIGIDPSWYPLKLKGQEKNILAFSIELLVEIAKKEQLQLAVIEMNWDNLVWGMKNKKYDAILSPMRPYTFYLKDFTFSDLYLMTGPVLVVPKKSKISSIKGLRGKEIGVVKGSSGALLLQMTPGILVEGYDSISETLDALADEQIEGALVEVLIAQDFVHNLYPETLKIASSPLNEEGLRLITLFKKSPTLVNRFNDGLKTLKKSGEYEKLLQKWGLSPDAKPVANLDQQIDSYLKKFLF